MQAALSSTSYLSGTRVASTSRASVAPRATTGELKKSWRLSFSSCLSQSCFWPSSPSFWSRFRPRCNGSAGTELPLLSSETHASRCLPDLMLERNKDACLLLRRERRCFCFARLSKCRRRPGRHDGSGSSNSLSLHSPRPLPLSCPFLPFQHRCRLRCDTDDQARANSDPTQADP